MIAASCCAGPDLVSGGGGCMLFWVEVGPALRCAYGIGLDWPAWRLSVADSSQVHEQILEWNGERMPDRYTKALANRWYDELRK